MSADPCWSPERVQALEDYLRFLAEERHESFAALYHLRFQTAKDFAAKAAIAEEIRAGVSQLCEQMADWFTSLLTDYFS